MQLDYSKVSIIRLLQMSGFIIIVSLIVIISIYSFYGMKSAKYLEIGENEIPSYSVKFTNNSGLKKIGDIELDKDFFNAFPDHSKIGGKWWQQHKSVYQRLVKNKTLSLVFEINEAEAVKVVKVSEFGPDRTMKNLWVGFLAGFIHIVIAISVFTKHKNTEGVLLGYVIAFISLYIICASPLFSRQITLPYDYIEIMFSLCYATASGMILLVHYALIYPSPPKIYIKYQKIIKFVIYFYLVLVLFIYFSGFIKPSEPFPFFIFFATVAIASFSYSILKEKDTFLKRQYILSLVSPVLVTAVFTFALLLPGVQGETRMDFSYMALISLILSFGLAYSMDNSRVYQEKLASEHREKETREKIRRSLHDDVLCNLSMISSLSESAKSVLGSENIQAATKMQKITETSRLFSQQLRGVLKVTGEDCDTWEKFSDYLRSLAYEITDPADIDFEMTLEINSQKHDSGLILMVCLFYVFREATRNAVTHSKGDLVESKLTVEPDEVTLQISDNGIGFERKDSPSGHYGLTNIQNRVEQVGGTCSIKSGRDLGSTIKVILPLS